MLSKSMGRGLLSGVVSDLPRRAVMAALVGVFVLAASGSAQAGGSCITSADCNLPTNFCRPGFCDLFGRCQSQLNDALCRVSPYGGNLFCNGVDYCEESLNRRTGGCAVNPSPVFRRSRSAARRTTVRRMSECFALQPGLRRRR